MATLLVTNDDGIDSPLLLPLVRALDPLGEVRVVVPSEERSWIGKAISRFDALRVETEIRDGVELYAVNGTPADCVSLGVHALFDAPPDIVVSGINLGLNFGSAFVLSSGTIGGAFEAAIAGVPAVAFSMALPNDAYGLSGDARVTALGKRPAVIAETCADIVRLLLGEKFPETVDCFSVNLPADAHLKTARRVTRTTRTGYGPLFVRGEDGSYRHRFSRLNVSATDLVADGTATSDALRTEGGDIDAIQRGFVAITPIRVRLDVELSESLRSRLESAD